MEPTLDLILDTAKLPARTESLFKSKYGAWLFTEKRCHRDIWMQSLSV